MVVYEIKKTLEIITPYFCKSNCGRIVDLQMPLELEEYKLSSKASSGRLSEFLAGRNSLKEAIKKISPIDPIIGRTFDGKPTLPSGLTGSISHKAPYVVSLAALNTHVLSLGIDIERVDNWDHNSSSIFTTHQDFTSFKNVELPFNIYCSILFSAKESAFKALNTISNDEGISIKGLSPSISQFSKSLYYFSLNVAGFQCMGRIAIIDKWVVATSWIL